MTVKSTLKSGLLLSAILTWGCGTSSNNVGLGGVTPPPAIVAPTAVADTFTIFGNGQVSSNLTTNDTLNSAAVTNFQNPSTSGGTVAVTPGGQLTYTPPLNASGITDTFTYTLSNGGGSSTATVTVNVQARGFFVRNDAPAGGTGTQANPFNTLAAATAAATGVNGAQIILFRGDGTSTGLNTAVPLGTNQGISSLDAANPATITGPITLSSGNSVRNLRIVGATGNAITGTASSNTQLSGVAISNGAGAGCSLVNATGTFTVTNCTMTNVGSGGAFGGIIASADSGNLLWSVTGSTFTNVNGVGVFGNVTNTAALNLTVEDCNSNNSNRNFVFVDANTTGTNVRTTMNRCVAVGDGVGGRGLNAQIRGTTNFLGLISANNVTNMGGEGMQVSVGDNAVGRMRFTGNRTLGNLANRGLVVFNSGAANPDTGCIFNNNTSDVFELGRALGTFRVEQLGLFNTTSGNTGTLFTSPGVVDVAAGSLGIP